MGDGQWGNYVVQNGQEGIQKRASGVAKRVRNGLSGEGRSKKGDREKTKKERGSSE